MKKVLIVYSSRTGNTEKMANYIAEGVRFTGNEVVLKRAEKIKNTEEIQGYDAYIFGSPTYHRDMIASMKQFLFLAQQAGLEGKLAGAFGSYTHSGDAPKMILDTMQYVLKMKVTDLGSFKLTEDKIDTQEGVKACQQYGKAIAEELG